jgi:hypothetical protein
MLKTMFSNVAPFFHALHQGCIAARLHHMAAGGTSGE